MSDIIKLLSSVPPDVIAALVTLIREVVASDDPKRTAERHAKMISARAASHAVAKKALR